MKNLSKKLLILTIVLIALITLCGCLQTGGEDVFVIEISIEGELQKDYFVGEELKVEGIRIKAIYEDGSFYYLALSEDMVTGFDTSTEGRREMRISYEGITTTFKYSVTDKNVLESLVYENNGDHIEIISIKSSYGKDSLTIPETIENLPVTVIREGAFRMSTFYTVSLPDSVTEICRNAFYDCANLTTVNTPQSLKLIGDNAFSKCLKLNNFVITDKIKSIGKYAFESTSIRIVNLSAKNKVGYGVFKNCNRMREITATFQNDQTLQNLLGDTYKITSVKKIDIIGTLNEINADLFKYGESNNYSINSYVEEVILPNGVEKIKASSFYGFTSLKSLSIPDTVSEIGDTAFKNCSSLNTFILSNNITTIGSSILENCYQLKNLTLYIDSEKNIGSYFGSSATNLSDLNLTVKTAATTLTRDFFKYKDSDDVERTCTGISAINLPEAITQIGDETFKEFTSLNNIDLTNITSIGKMAFEGCNSLDCLIGLAATELNYLNSLTNNIGEDAFKNCSSLKSLILPKELKNIGSNILQGASKITDFSASFYIDQLGVGNVGLGWFFNTTKPNLQNLTLYNSTEISNATFKIGNETLTTLNNVVFPDTIEVIQERALENLNITSFNVPNSITEIKESAFENCAKLESIDISNTDITSICKNAFKGCISLRTFTTNAKLQTIGESCFENCSSLIQILLPNTLNSVGKCAFKDCTNLDYVLFRYSPSEDFTEIPESAFENCIKLKKIYDGQSDILHYGERYVVLPQKVTSIGANAFKNCSLINNVILSRSESLGITSIGNSAFENCSNIINLNIQSVTVFGDSAFKGCGNINSILFNTSDVEVKIGKSAFENCSCIQQVILGANVTEVKEKAFNNCSAIGILEILNSNINIYPNVFQCESTLNLTSLKAPLRIKEYNAQEDTFGEKCDINLSYYFGSSCNADYGLEKLTQLEVLDGLQNLTFGSGDYTLKGAENLETLILPSSIVKIYEKAFSKFTQLKVLTSPLYVKNEENNDNFRDINYLFGTSYVGLENLNILNNSLSVSGFGIPDNAFKNCTGLININLEKATSIGVDAFSGCSNLVSIGNLTMITSIGDGAFSGCSIGNGTDNNNLIFPNTLINLGKNAFKGNSFLVEVSFAEDTDFTTLTIGEAPFDSCVNIVKFTAPFGFGISKVMSKLKDYFGNFNKDNFRLTELNVLGEGEIPTEFLNDVNDHKYLGIQNLTLAVEKIGAQAFMGCTNISEISFSNLTELGNSAFKGCTALTDVSLPDTLEKVGSSVFEGCTSLHTLTSVLYLATPDNDTKGLKNLNYLFGGETNFTQINIESLTIIHKSTVTLENLTINSDIFSGKSSLKSLTLGNNVIFGTNQFSQCENINFLKIENTSLLNYPNGLLKEDKSDLKIQVPNDVFESYYNNASWVNVKDKLKMQNHYYVDCVIESGITGYTFSNVDKFCEQGNGYTVTITANGENAFTDISIKIDGVVNDDLIADENVSENTCTFTITPTKNTEIMIIGKVTP